jgi:mRNA-degrading endonuclease RelE of RelBE toxin-antitoxin system
VWQVVFSDAAVRHWKKVPKRHRATLMEGVRKHLADSDPFQATRNKFPLRRPSAHAEFELRIDTWRLFYRRHADAVEVVLIGEKRGNKLFIEGEEFTL